MRRLLLASCLCIATLSGCASVAVSPSPGIARVLADPARSAADRERDTRDKPAEVLALAKFKRGDTVADILAGATTARSCPASSARTARCCWSTIPVTTTSARRASPSAWPTTACPT